MAAANVDPKVAKAFGELSKMNYADQAVYFLNGFWEDGIDKEAETLWRACQKFTELDKAKKDGNELDEWSAHKLLEHFDSTLTVIAMRQQLRQIDVDSNGKMSLMEYVVWRYKKSLVDTVNAPQGGNQEELDRAKKAFAEVAAALEQSQKAEAEVKAAEAEAVAAANELQAQEDAYHKKIKDLEDKTKDDSLGVVKRNRAAAELEQVKSEDPLPLRKAKISQEASVRKVTKQRVAAEKATAEVENRLAEAKEQLEAAKRGGGIANGAIWWMEREIIEAEKYLPKKKQVKSGGASTSK